MPSLGRTEATERERTVIRFSLCAILLASPLPFGGVGPLAVLSLQLSAACVGMLALRVIHRECHPVSREAKRMFIPVLLLGAVGIFQLLPLPHSLLAALSGPSSAARVAQAGVVPELNTALAPISVSPPDTVDALLRFAAYVMLGLAAAVSIRNRGDFKWIAWAIVASAVFQAFYGSVELVSGRQQIFFYAKRHYLDCATGTFINRNHFAGYLAMALPFAMAACFGRRRRQQRPTSWRGRVTDLTEGPALWRVFAGLGGFMIVVGIFLSRSRGGLAAALIGAAMLFKGLAAGRRRALGLVCVFLVPATFVLWQGLAAPGTRFLTLGEETSLSSGRLAVWTNSLDLVRSHPLGTGFGTFHTAFRSHRPESIRLQYDHAHNDWLQAAVEGGAPSLVAVMVMGGLIFFTRPVRRPGARPRAFDAAILAALAAIGLQSLVDFSLRIPSLAAMVAVLVGARVSFLREPARGRD